MSHKDDVAMTTDGQILPMEGDAVRAYINAALADPNTEVVAVILRKGNDLMCPVLGEPSPELAQTLRQVADVYSRLFGNESMTEGPRH